MEEQPLQQITEPYATTFVGGTSQKQSNTRVEETVVRSDPFSHQFDLFLSQPNGEQKWQQLYDLYESFLECSGQYAKTIFSERGVPEEPKEPPSQKEESYKTIKSWATGGQLGGTKFRIHGIVFKYCIDVKRPNGVYLLGGGQSDIEKAIKLGSHELKGANILLSSTSDLRVTLVSMVDYRGYRMTAMAELPGIGTPIFGSHNGGENFFWNEYVSKLLRKVGTHLNLLPHSSSDSKYSIQLAQDVEVHYIEKFKHYYVLDLSRLMSPDPCLENGSHYCHFFRPEFLKQLTFPVSSEVGNFIIKKESHLVTWTIKTAQKVLRSKIQQYAVKLFDKSDNRIAYQFASSYKEMCYQLHLNGINLRYMGLLVCDLNGINPTLSVHQNCLDTLCIEMIARTLKLIAHAKMRGVTCTRPHGDTKQIKEVMVKILNYDIDYPAFEETLKRKYFKTHQYDVPVEDITNFPNENIEIYKELIKCYHSTQDVATQDPSMFMEMIKNKMKTTKNEVISRLLVLANWKVDENALKVFQKQPDYVFNIIHIGKIDPRFKYLGCVDYANAKFQLELLKKGTITKDHHLRLDAIIDLLKSSLYKSYTIPDVWLSLMDTTIEYLRFNYDVHYIEWTISSWIQSFKSPQEDLDLQNTTTYCHSYLLDKINMSKEEDCENLTIFNNLSEGDCLEWAKMNLKKLFFYCKNPNSNHLFRSSIYYFCKSLHGDNWKFFTFCSMKINFSSTENTSSLEEFLQNCSIIPEHLHLKEAPETILQLVQEILKKTKMLTLKWTQSWAWCGRNNNNKQTYYPKAVCKELEEAYQEWLSLETTPKPKVCKKFSEKMNSTSTLAPQGHKIQFEMNSVPMFTQVNCGSGSERRVVREEGWDHYKVVRVAILARSLALLREVLPANHEVIIELEKFLASVKTSSTKTNKTI